MEQFTKDQKIGAYKRLSEKEKEFIASDETTEIYQQIGKKNGLLLDATGKMSDIVFLAIIGLVRSTEIRGELQKALGLPDAKLDALLNDINQNIFIPFRSILESETEGERIAENPPEIKTTAVPSTTESKPETVAPAAPTDLVAAKLAQPISVPTQKTVVTAADLAKPTAPAAQTTPEKPKTYAADPYREPLA